MSDGEKKKKKVGRNDPCPCGSGTKYKACHGSPERTKPPTVVVAWSSAGLVDARFAKSLARVMKHPAIVGVADKISGPRMAANRNAIVREFLSVDAADWLWMLDADMAFAPNTLSLLLDTADPVDRPVVGGLCFSINDGVQYPVAFVLGEEGASHLYRVMNYPPDTRVKVDATGAACLLIHRSVLERLREAYPDPHPWFQDTIRDGRDIGEDVEFCLRLREQGIDLWLDTRVDVDHVKSEVLNKASYARRLQDRFVITGSGRCGTGYVAQVLATLGLPVGHEAVYNPTTPEGSWGPYRGDVSWLAAPALAGFQGPVIHLTRDPLETLRSLVGIQFLGLTVPGHEPYERVALDELRWTDLAPTEDRTELIRRAGEFWLHWTGLADARASARIKIEDLSESADAFLELLHSLGFAKARHKVEQALVRVSTSYNHRDRAEDLTWDELPRDLRQIIRSRAHLYGYETPEAGPEESAGR